MADTVSRLIERTLPELEDFKVRGLFNDSEIRAIVKARTDFEYRINARAPDKVDYLRYIKYEHTLDALRIKRKARLSSKVSSISDHACEKRMHFIFSRALKKFQGDLTLWNQYIDFAMRGSSTSRLSKIFPEALRLHPTASQLWIKAAVWEYRHNSNIATARMHMQRAIRLNGNEDHLWIEYFRLELDYVRKVRARRKVLGIATATATTSTTMTTTATKDDDDSNSNSESDNVSNSDNDSDNEDTTNRKRKRKRNVAGPVPPPVVEKSEAEVTVEFLKGTIPFIVYSNACNTIQTNSVAFNVQFLGACGNDFPWLSSTILDKCRESFETSETFWDMYARLPETSDKELEEITKIATPYSDGFELPEDAPIQNEHVDETEEEQKVRVVLEINKRYKEAVQCVPTSVMWSKYLQWQMNHLEDSTTPNTSNTFTTSNTSNTSSTLEMFATAHRVSCLEPEMYRHWARYTVMNNTSSTTNSTSNTTSKQPITTKSSKRRRTTRSSSISSTTSSSSSSLSNVGTSSSVTLRLTPLLVAQYATSAHPTSTVAWKIHINVMQQGLTPNDPTQDIAALNAVYLKATESIEPNEKDAWEIEAMWMQLKCHTSKRKKWKSIVKKCLFRMRTRKYTNDAMLSLLNRCHTWMDVDTCRKVMKFVIESGEVFSTKVPMEIFRMCVAKEMRAVKGQGKLCALNVRNVYEQYIKVHSQRVQSWLEYARYELEFGEVSTLSRVNWRAKKGIGIEQLDTWESEFAKIKMNAL